MKKIMITIGMLTLVVLALIGINAQTRDIHIIDDTHDINWDEINVGDKIITSYNNLNHWTDYKLLQDTIDRNQVTYNQEDNVYHVESVDNEPANIEPTYGINLNQPFYFGSHFDSDDLDSYPYQFSDGGLVEIVTRPNYERNNPNKDWAASGTGENAWLFSYDSGKLILKYKADGNSGSVKTIDMKYRNTVTMFIDPVAQVSTIAVCQLPEDNTTYDCRDDAATNYEATTTTIRSKFLDNKFLTVRYYGGDDSGLDVSGLAISAMTGSMSQIQFDNTRYYVPVSTDLSEVHTMVDPEFYEFINGTVTHAGTKVPYANLINDGGYDKNTPGVYVLTYDMENGYSSSSHVTGTVEVEVMKPEEVVTMSATDYTIDTLNAPTTEADIISAMNVSALSEAKDYTSSIYISSYGGYNITNPTSGLYPITFSVVNDYDQHFYYKANLRIVDNAQIENIDIKETLVDKDFVTFSDTLDYSVTITNNSKINLDGATFTYYLDNNILDTTTITNINITDGATIENIDGQLVINISKLNPTDSITFSYTVNSKTDIYISSLLQEVDSFNNHGLFQVFDTRIDYDFLNTVDPLMFTAFNNTFSMIDVDEDDLVTANEMINVKHTFENDSEYHLEAVSLSNEEHVDKLTTDFAINLSVTSDLRELTEDDYKVYGEEEVVVYNILPNENIEVTYQVKATETFHNISDVKMVALSQVLVGNEVYHQEQLEDTIPLDLDNIISYKIDTQIVDTDDSLVDSSESLKLIIDIGNDGYVDINNGAIYVDLSDQNILEKELDSSMITIQNSDMVTAPSKNTRTNFTVNNNTIKINSIIAGSSKRITINLHATDRLKIDQYLENPKNASVVINTKLSSAVFDTDQTNSMQLDYNDTASVSASVDVVETTGDGDLKVDPLEVFTYSLNIENNGSIDLNNFIITEDINNNNGMSIDNIEVNFLNEDGTENSDYKILDDKMTITNFDVGTIYKVNIKVTYGDIIYTTSTDNSFTYNHPFISSSTIISNVLVDYEDYHDVEVTFSHNKDTVAPGDIVEFYVDIENKGRTTERDIDIFIDSDEYNLDFDSIVDMVIIDQDDNELVLGDDYELNFPHINIYDLSPGESIHMSVSAELAYPMYISATTGRDYTIDVYSLVTLHDGDTVEDLTKLTPDLSASSISATNEFKTGNDSELVSPGQLVTNRFELTNTADVNMTNTYINFDITDLGNIHDFTLNITSDDPLFSYNVNYDEYYIYIDNLAAGSNVVVETQTYIDTYFDSSDTIDLVVGVNSDFFSIADTKYSLYKDFSSSAKASFDSELIETTSGNLYVGPSEQVHIDYMIGNEGIATLHDLEVEFVSSESEFESVSIAKITNKAGDEITDYSFEGNKLTISDIPANEVYTVHVMAQTKDVLEFTDNLIITATLSHEYLDDIVEETYLQLDLSKFGDLSIEQTLIKDELDGDGVLDPGEHITAHIEVTNTGIINLEDIHIKKTSNDINLVDELANFTIMINQSDTGFVEFDESEYILDVEDRSVHINSIPGDSVIVIEYDITAEDVFYPATVAKVSTNFNFEHPTHGPTNYDVERSIGLDLVNNLDLITSYSIENKNGDASVLPSDDVYLNYHIQNTGKVVLSDFNIYTNLDKEFDYSSIALDSSTMSGVTLDNSSIVIEELKPSESVDIILSIKLSDNFADASDIVNIVGYNYYNLYEEDIVSEVSIPVDVSDLSYTPTIEVVGSGTGDRDGLVDPNELLLVTIAVENNSAVGLDKTVIDYSEYSDNVLELSNISSSGVIDTDAQTVTFDSIPGNSKAIVTYSARFKPTFNADEVADFKVLVNQNTLGYQEAIDTWVIDVNHTTELISSLTYQDADLDGDVSANEVINFTYTMNNIGTRAVSNIVIKDRTNDRNLTNVAYNQVLYIDGVETAFEYNAETKEYTIDYLPAGSELVLNYDMNTETQITGLLQKLFLFNIKVSIGSADDSATFSNSDSERIGIDPTVAQMVVTTEFMDDDTDLLINADENTTYSINIENKGDFELDNIRVDTKQSGINMINEEIEVIDQDDNVLVLGEDYNINEDLVTIKALSPKDTYTIVYSAKAPSTLTEGTHLNYSTTVRQLNIKNQSIYDSYGISIDDLRDTTEVVTLAGETSNDNLELTLNSDMKTQITLTNNGSANERDTEFKFTNVSNNLNLDYENYTVYRNGSDYTSSVYADLSLENGIILIIPTFNAGDEIVITFDTKFKNSIVDDHLNDDFIDVSIDSQIKYDDTNIKTASYDGKINIDPINNLALSISTFETVAGNNLVNTSEDYTTVITLSNNGALMQEDVVLNLDFDHFNILENSLYLDSVKNDSGNSVMPTNYKSNLEDNEFIVNKIPGFTDYIITYRYTTKPTVELNTDDSKITDTYLVNGVSGINYYLDVLPLTKSQTKYDNSESSFDYNIEYTGSDIVAPGDDFNVKFTGYNDGKVHEEDIDIFIDLIDGGVDYSKLTSVTLLRNGEVMDSSQYSHDATNHKMTFYDLFPGDIITGELTYAVDETPYNYENVLFSSTLIDPFNDKITRYAQPYPTLDLSDTTPFSVSSTIENDDADKNEQLDPGEEVYYDIHILNDGNVNYNQLDVYIDFSSFDVNVEDLVFDVELISSGEHPIFEVVDITNEIIHLQIYNILVGEEYTISTSFIPNSVKSQNHIAVDIYSTINSVSHTNKLLGHVDVDRPLVEKDAPYVSGNDYYSEYENTTHTNDELLDLFNVQSNEIYSDLVTRELSVNHSIDYNVPGIYEVEFKITDSDDDTLSDSYIAKYEVVDVLPTLDSDDSIILSKGDNLDDYINQLNVVATEFDYGDLNDYVILDDLTVDYNTVGNYEARLSVIDSDGNKVIKVVNVEIVNNLYPIISANDTYLTIDQASTITNDADLIKVLNAKAYDYNLDDITNQVVIDDVDNFLDGAISIDDVYNFNLSITNYLGYTANTTAKIIISDVDYKVSITSNNPVSIKVTDSIDYDELSTIANVEAVITQDNEVVLKTNLNSSNIIYTNLDASTAGEYQVVYKYQNEDANLEATHILVVYVSDDGYFIDNDDVKMKLTLTQDVIMPGDVLSGSVHIINNAKRAKPINEFSISTSDSNINALNIVNVTDLDGNEIDYSTTKNTRSSSGDSIYNIVMDKGMEYDINFEVVTNELFKHASNINFVKSLTLDGEPFETTSQVAVDEKAIDLTSEVNFDKEIYNIDEDGVLTITITNNGTMDSDHRIIDLYASLTNADISKVLVDGELVFNETDITVPAKSSIVIEIHFVVREEVYLGDDLISFLDEFGNSVDIEIPINTSPVIDGGDETTVGGDETTTNNNVDDGTSSKDDNTHIVSGETLYTGSEFAANHVISIFTIIVGLFIMRKFIK